ELPPAALLQMMQIMSSHGAPDQLRSEPLLAAVDRALSCRPAWLLRHPQQLRSLREAYGRMLRLQGGGGGAAAVLEELAAREEQLGQKAELRRERRSRLMEVAREGERQGGRGRRGGRGGRGGGGWERRGRGGLGREGNVGNGTRGVLQGR
ncbi:hypothetical protein Agub_g12270, partial [Astrephomene gubernaculifera]